MIEAFELTLSRHAFSPRDAARAGDVWRLLQDAAVIGSTRRGWSPQRYREAGCAFIVRTMTVVHHREARFGEPLAVRTWVSTFRRSTFTDRQIRVAAAEPVVSASQAWVHVTTEPEVRAARASDALREAFVVTEDEPDVTLPAWTDAEGPAWDFGLQAWHTWMDPLGHANHPAYVDWCDEALSRRIAASGGDPVRLRPIAEEVRFRSGVVAPEQVTVRSRLVGRTPEGHAVCHHDVLGGDARICATATTIRELVDDHGALATLLAGPR